MPLSTELTNELADLQEDQLVALCRALGIDKRTRKTAFAALCTQPQERVSEALATLREVEAEDAVRSAAAVAKAAPPTDVPMCTFVCEGRLEFTYNRPYVFEPGKAYTVPFAVGKHAAQVARSVHGGPHMFSLERIKSGS